MTDPIIAAFAAGFAVLSPVVAYLFRALMQERARRVDPVKADAEPPPSEPRDGPRVLLVDDDPAGARILHRALEPLGVRVDAAESAEHALRILRDDNYTLVIVDLRLPGLSGEDLVTHIREMRPRILLMSGIAPEELAETAERCGADGYLGKDGSLHKLTETVARLINPAPPSRQSRPG